jgi:hypothetical protein
MLSTPPIRSLAVGCVLCFTPIILYLKVPSGRYFRICYLPVWQSHNLHVCCK